jgi:large conductance mechanosensitive channel
MEEVMKYIKEFKEFIARGNVIDLAVGVVIGSSFSEVVSSVTKNFINPIIDGVSQLIGFQSGLVLKLGTFSFGVGEILNAIIQFLITAYCVFIIVKVTNRFFKKQKKEEEKVETKPEDVVLLEEIRDLLKKSK